MAHKTDMTGKLLLLIAAFYALTSLISLSGDIMEAQSTRDGLLTEVTELRESISALENSAPDIEDAARKELKMVCEGEKLIIPGP